MGATHLWVSFRQPLGHGLLIIPVMNTTSPSAPFKAPLVRAISCAVAGGRHLREGKPCQDAAMTLTVPRPVVMVCDGKGSASHSEIGALYAISVIPHLLYQIEGPLAAALDYESADNDATWKRCAILLVRGLAAEQAKAAIAHGGVARDYEFTVVLAIVGKYRTGWLSIGDSCLVANYGKESSRIGLVNLPMTGEFSSSTRFVRYVPNPESDLAYGTFPVDGLHGLMAFSDGVATRLLCQQTLCLSPGVANIFSWTELDNANEELCAFLCAELWKETIDDDRSLAVLTLSEKETYPIIKHSMEEPLTATTLFVAPLEKPHQSKANNPILKFLIILLILVGVMSLVVWCIDFYTTKDDEQPSVPVSVPEYPVIEAPDVSYLLPDTKEYPSDISSIFSLTT